MDSPDKAAPAQALAKVKALAFDVFGTVVDWRAAVTRDLVHAHKTRLAEGFLPDTDHQAALRFQALTEDNWSTFAQQWRHAYTVFTQFFVPGKTPWKDIDDHHYDSLVDLLSAWAVSGVYSDLELRNLSLVWHRLGPWYDSPSGIKTLGARFVTATLSNGTRSLLQDLNNHGDLGFQTIISTADFGAYKPHPTTYLGAAHKLGCEPHQVAMVAAHLNDLEAARRCDLRTIYVERPREEAWAPEDPRYQDARQWVDVWVSADQDGLLEVARRLGIEIASESHLQD